MRRANGSLGGIAAIDLRQSPVIVTTLAVMQLADVEKPTQQPGNNAQGIRFEILESGF
jgi:hypothetical protein